MKGKSQIHISKTPSNRICLQLTGMYGKIATAVFDTDEIRHLSDELAKAADTADRSKEIQKGIERVHRGE